MKRLAIFASGGGSNAEQIIQHVAHEPDLEVALIVSNRKKAGVLERAERHGIPTFYNHREVTITGLIDQLKTHNIDWIALAGYLKKIPLECIQAYPDKIINIHPALLPHYGGEGMYGHHVHQAVSETGDSTSGMTIHYVNEHYDEGKIIFQASCDITPHEDASVIATKVLELEHRYYPRILATLMNGVISETRAKYS